ncbi:peptidase S8 [Halobacteriales archaeon QS_9_67_17]|nr:MAG: peptidase S8 [Halobacteriales archaeon QS_9_67_17]
MSGDNVSRRTVLRTAGALGAGTVLAAGTGGAAGKPPARIVGTTDDAGKRAAADRAESVKRTFDFGDVGKAVAGRFADEAVDALTDRDDVRYVEADGTMTAIGGPDKDAPGGEQGPPGGGGGSTSECLPWGVDRVDGDVTNANGETGSGADIAIIDTGIDDDHPDLQANVGAGKAFADCRGSNCNYPWSDDDNHGTHCAGIADAPAANGEGVQGVATEATLHAVKVLDNSGSGSYSDVAAGIEYTADQGWDVGSLSLGGGQSSVVSDACTYAYNNGVLLVAAAGNDGPCTDCVGYPAAEPEVIAVSSTDTSDSLSSFSSTGSEVELAAPGSNVYSTVIGGYDTYSGTSMACPHVSGAGGLLMSNGDANTTARDTLTANAEDISLASNEQGSGLLDAAAALGLDSSDDGTGSC